MNPQKAAEEIKTIRALMERPVRYSTQSGVAGIVAGLIALCGLAGDWLLYTSILDLETRLLATMGMWAWVFVAALVAVLALTRIRERRQGMPIWSSVKKRILLTILPPFVAGAGLTLAIVYHWYVQDTPNSWHLIPPVWMLFYGVACWQVGEFSTVEIRVMGAAFIAAGLVTALLFPVGFLCGVWMPYITLGATFGGFHLVYGVAVLIRHGG